MNFPPRRGEEVSCDQTMLAQHRDLSRARSHTMCFISQMRAVRRWACPPRKENITWSMLTGHKEAFTEDAIRSSHPILGIVFLVLISFITLRMFQNYVSAAGTTTFPGPGIAITLAESEGSEGGDDDVD